VKALENEASNDQRFIVTTDKKHFFIEIATLLKQNGYPKASTKKAPGFLLKIVGLFDREVKDMLPFVDVKVSADTEPAKTTLNWEPLPFEQMVLDTAESITAGN